MSQNKKFINSLKERLHLLNKISIMKFGLMLFVFGTLWTFGVLYVSFTLGSTFDDPTSVTDLKLDDFESTKEYVEYLDQRYPERSQIIFIYSVVTLIGGLTVPFLLILLIAEWKWLWKKEFRRENW